MGKLLLNTKECAYDAFGTELKIGDKVVFAASRWTGDYILCKGTVVGWTQKMVKIECTAGATNSDKPADEKGKTSIHPVGKIQNRKPDKMFKIPEAAPAAVSKKFQLQIDGIETAFAANRDNSGWSEGL